MSAFEVHQEDALVFLQRLPAESVDLIVTDPPYESINKWRNMGSARCRRLIDWFPTVSYEYLADCLEEMLRVLKPNAHCYVMGDWETTHAHVYPDAERLGWGTWPPVVWDKGAVGTGYHYRNCIEYVSFLEKGKRALNSKSETNPLRFKSVRGKHAYPTEKPVTLCETLVRQSSNKGDVVLDPFCGGGSVGVAAQRLGRRFVGVDVWEKGVELARGALAHDMEPYLWAASQGIVFRPPRDRKALRKTAVQDQP